MSGRQLPAIEVGGEGRGGVWGSGLGERSPPAGSVSPPLPAAVSSQIGSSEAVQFEEQ